MRYRCPKCDRIYEEMTQDGMCEKAKCLGEELVEFIENSRSAEKREEEKTGRVLPSVPVGVIEGLCLLVCDISFSMNDPAFADSELIKLKMVTRAVHRAVVEMYRISRPDEAYIGIIAFGARAVLVPDRKGRPFLLSISEIQREFGDDGLNTYLFESFDTDAPGVNRRYTDITAALQLAREIYDGAIAGDLTPFGVSEGVSILKHVDICTADNKIVTAPNVRVLLYSDGEYNPENRRPLSNPFESLSPSPLMTAFIGDESVSEDARRGADQMKALANTCVMHRKKGYFLINNAERYAVLRLLFRMASGASGFCPECLKGYIDSIEEEEPRAMMRREEGAGD